MAKLIIQIPCYNEEQTLGVTLSCLPRTLTGIETIEWLVIDDGSTDHTVDVAVAHSVDHVVRLPLHVGLAKAFTAGLEAALKAGADIIVNTDADNQYASRDIAKLIEPILTGRADFVVGVRPIGQIAHFSQVKKWLQKMGSWVVRRASRTDIPDAPSGFRAMSRKAAMQLNVFSEYSYTLETIIQAGQKRMAILAVPVETGDDLRPSRLVKSVPVYIMNSMMTILRIFVTYRPLPFFAMLGILFLVPGLLISLRFMYFYLSGQGAGHVQSLLLSVLLMGTAFFLLVTALVVDLIAVNRQLLEKLDWRIQEIDDYLRKNKGNG